MYWNGFVVGEGIWVGVGIGVCVGLTGVGVAIAIFVGVGVLIGGSVTSAVGISVTDIVLFDIDSSSIVAGSGRVEKFFTIMMIRKKSVMRRKLTISTAILFQVLRSMRRVNRLLSRCTKILSGRERANVKSQE